jgi:mannose-6-phosphate isomerase-like protein (cupin superfamily)
MMKLKVALLAAFFGASLFAAQNPVDYFTTSDLKQLAQKLTAQSKKEGGFAGETLTRYGNHLTMLAHRERTGSSEVHEKVNDVFVIVDGDCSLLTGGKMVNPKTTATNEIRGSGIQGGTSRKLGVGDIVHISAGVPHQVVLAPGHHITYFVVKVNE